MVTHNKDRPSTATIVQAVETLSNIAELDYEKDIGIACKHEETIANHPVIYQTVHWMHPEDNEYTLSVVRDTFKVVLDYLRQFYAQEYDHVDDSKTIEGIKTIMVLVGEAARKLDKFTHLFKQSQIKTVTDFREFKELQDFYQTRIARKIDEGILSKWVFALSNQYISRATGKIKLKGAAAAKTKHVFVDLDSVKKDSEYELFSLRKEDGSRFFNARLIRNLKLVFDFGDYFGSAQEKDEDPLQEVGFWVDQCCQSAAKSILQVLGSQIDMFYREIYRFRDRDLISSVNKTLMALMLSSHPKNLKRNNPTKCCSEYFFDFQRYLREVLANRDYEKWTVYPPKANNKVGRGLLNIIYSLCRSLFTEIQLHAEITPYVAHLLREAVGLLAPIESVPVKSKQIWERLSQSYLGLSQLFKFHPNGPLMKVLDNLEDGNYNLFDPILQQNLPCQLYTILNKDRKIMSLKIPSPTTQEFIQKAAVLEEFKAFIRGYETQLHPQKHLFINLQDRTGWKEYARSHAIEALTDKDKNFGEGLVVVTLPADTEFFHQLPPYHLDNHAEIFMTHLKEHIGEESSGFLFPKAIKKTEITKFTDGIIGAIHRVFFSSRNVLMRENRMNFIEIFYFFLELKLLELVQPASFSLSCKDSIDIGSTSNVLFFILLKLISQNKCDEQELQHLDYMLHSAAFLIRERPVQPERFNRMLSALKTVELLHQELGHDNFRKLVLKEFGPYFRSETLDCRIALPKAGK